MKKRKKPKQIFWDSKRDYLKALAALGLNQSAAGRFLGLAPRTGRAYALGESEPPLPIVMLLAVMIAYKITPQEARSAAALPEDFGPDTV